VAATLRGHLPPASNGAYRTRLLRPLRAFQPVCSEGIRLSVPALLSSKQQLSGAGGSDRLSSYKRNFTYDAALYADIDISAIIIAKPLSFVKG